MSNARLDVEQEDWFAEFRDLLYTWELYESKLRPQDEREPPDPTLPGWQDAYERRYGDGELTQRRQIFRDTLEMLRDNGVDLQVACGALRAEKRAAVMRTMATQASTVGRRNRQELKETHEELIRAANRALAVYRVDGVPIRNDLTRTCETIITLCESLEHALTTSYDEQAGEPQRKPWAKEARQRLMDAGVPAPAHQTKLLIAIGLLPITSIPTTE